MANQKILHQIFDYKNRANPYPLFTQLRQTPVSWQEDGPAKDGTYVVSTYREIAALLHDPRISSDFRNCLQDPEPRTSNCSISFYRPGPAGA